VQRNNFSKYNKDANQGNSHYVPNFNATVLKGACHVMGALNASTFRTKD
jgi:hypothetical protein